MNAEERHGPATGYALRGRQAAVIDDVGRAIVAGRYAPSSALPTEAELGEQFGVSRTSIREAMKVLAAKGLLDIRKKVGTRVRRVEQWNAFDLDILRWMSEDGRGDELLRDLIEVRQTVEPEAARLAAGRATMTDLARLDAALAGMGAARDAADSIAYADADVEFHQAVYAASHNDLLRQLGTVVGDFLRLSFAVQQRTTTAAELDDDVESHRAVLDAIHRGAAEPAGAAMLDLVLDGKRALVRALGRATDAG